MSGGMDDGLSKTMLFLIILLQKMEWCNLQFLGVRHVIMYFGNFVIAPSTSLFLIARCDYVKAAMVDWKVRHVMRMPEEKHQFNKFNVVERLVVNLKAVKDAAS